MVLENKHSDKDRNIRGYFGLMSVDGIGSKSSKEENLGWEWLINLTFFS